MRPQPLVALDDLDGHGRAAVGDAADAAHVVAAALELVDHEMQRRGHAVIDGAGFGCDQPQPAGVVQSVFFEHHGRAVNPGRHAAEVEHRASVQRPRSLVGVVAGQADSAAHRQAGVQLAAMRVHHRFGARGGAGREQQAAQVVGRCGAVRGQCAGGSALRLGPGTGAVRRPVQPQDAFGSQAQGFDAPCVLRVAHHGHGRLQQGQRVPKLVVGGTLVQRRDGGAQLPASQRGQHAFARRGIGQQQRQPVSPAQPAPMQPARHGVHALHQLRVAEPVPVASMRRGGQRQPGSVRLCLLAQPVRHGDVVKGMERIGGHGAGLLGVFPGND